MVASPSSGFRRPCSGAAPLLTIRPPCWRHGAGDRRGSAPQGPACFVDVVTVGVDGEFGGEGRRVVNVRGDHVPADYGRSFSSGSGPGVFGSSDGQGGGATRPSTLGSAKGGAEGSSGVCESEGGSSGAGPAATPSTWPISIAAAVSSVPPNLAARREAGVAVRAGAACRAGSRMAAHRSSLPARISSFSRGVRAERFTTQRSQ